MCVSDTLAAPQGGAPLRCAGPLLTVGLQTVNIMKYYCVRYIRIVIDYTLGLNGIGHRVTVQVKSGSQRQAIPVPNDERGIVHHYLVLNPLSE